MECRWEGRGGPLRLRRQLSLPSIFLERKEKLSPTSGPAMACMPTLRLPCSLMSSEELAKLDAGVQCEARTRPPVTFYSC